jgi:hypothetical protein
VIISEPKSTGAFHLLADEVTQGDIPLGLMQTLLRSRLCRMPRGRHIKDERKALDGSIHQTGDAAFTPATPQPRPEALESQHRLTQLTQHATHESKTKYALLYAKGHSAQPCTLWRIRVAFRVFPPSRDGDMRVVRYESLSLLSLANLSSCAPRNLDAHGPTSHFPLCPVFSFCCPYLNI